LVRNSPTTKLISTNTFSKIPRAEIHTGGILKRLSRWKTRQVPIQSKTRAPPREPQLRLRAATANRDQILFPTFATLPSGVCMRIKFVMIHWKVHDTPSTAVPRSAGLLENTGKAYLRLPVKCRFAQSMVSN